MTVRELAALSKVTYVQISRYEQGAAVPSPEIIKRLTENLGLPAGYFSAEPDRQNLSSERNGMLNDFAAMKKANLNSDQITAIRSVIKLVRSQLSARIALG